MDNPTVAQIIARVEWVAALRSDRFTQTTGRLYREESGDGAPAGHCCLGVAERLRKALFVPAIDDGGMSNGIGVFCPDHGDTDEEDDNVVTSTLTPTGMRRLGFDKSYGEIHLPAPIRAMAEAIHSWQTESDTAGTKLPHHMTGELAHEVALSNLNDDGFTFAQIADVIEAFLIRPYLNLRLIAPHPPHPGPDVSATLAFSKTNPPSLPGDTP